MKTTRDNPWEAIEKQTIVAEPEKVHVKVNRFEVTEPGPVILDGKEIRHITGIRLAWSVEDRLWRLEIDQVLLP